MSTPITTVGSLDELVTARVTEFVRTGINNPRKVSLIETAWHASAAATAAAFEARLDGTASPEAVRRDLEQLVEAGLLVRSAGANRAACYRLTDDPGKCRVLGHLLEPLVDPNFRARALAQLRYGFA